MKRIQGNYPDVDLDLKQIRNYCFYLIFCVEGKLSYNI